jgi:hypothetical protein
MYFRQERVPGFGDMYLVEFRAILSDPARLGAPEAPSGEWSMGGLVVELP